MVEQGIVLGHVISSRGIEVDKSKIDIMHSLPPPTNMKEVRSFLEHVDFYRRFIKGLFKNHNTSLQAATKRCGIPL